MQHYLISAFILGLVGSLHCIGMCGGIAVGLGCSTKNRITTITRQLLYNLGRIFTYGFIGAISGYSGFIIKDWKPFTGFQQILAVASGIIMIIIGLNILGLFKNKKKVPDSFNEILGIRALQTLYHSKSLLSSLYIGIFNGFLPCLLVYAAATMALSSTQVFSGLMIMFVFGTGTVPSLFILGCGSNAVTARYNKFVPFTIGAAVSLMGAITILRATPAFDICLNH